MAFTYNPVTGLLNTTSFPTRPLNETAARQQFMTLLDQLKDFLNKHGVVGTDTGTTDSLVVTITPTITTYTDCLLIVKVNNTNTGASTININSVGAVAIKKNGSEALIAGDLVEDGYALLVFDGTYFQLVNAKNDLAIISSNISVLQGDMTAAQSSITSLQSSMTAAQNNISSLQNEMDTAQDNIADLKKWRYITLLLA